MLGRLLRHVQSLDKNAETGMDGLAAPRLRSLAAALLRLVCGRVGALLLATLTLVTVRGALELAAARDFFVALLAHGLVATAALAGLASTLVPDLVRHARPSTSRDQVIEATLVRATRRAAAAALVFALLMVALGTDSKIACVGVALFGLPYLLHASASLAVGDTRVVVAIEVLGRFVTLALTLVLSLCAVNEATAYLACWIVPQLFVARLARRRLASADRLAFARGMRRAFVLGGPTPRASNMEPHDREHALSVSRATQGDLLRAGYFHGGPLLLAAMVGEAFADFGFAHRLFAIAALVPAALTTTLAGPLGLVTAPRGAALGRAIAILGALGLVLAGCLVAGGQILSESSAVHDHVLRLAAALPALCVASLALPYLIAHRELGAVLRCSALGCVTTFAAMLGLQASYGLAGAAIGIVVGEVSVAVFAVLAVARSSNADNASNSSKRTA